MSIASGFVGRDLVMGWGGSPIAGVREKGLAFDGEPINVTDDDDDGWRTLLTDVGERQVDLSLSGVTKSHALKTDFLNGTQRVATFTYPDGAVLTVTAQISSYQETGSYQDATTFEATVMSSGVVTLTP